MQNDKLENGEIVPQALTPVDSTGVKNFMPQEFTNMKPSAGDNTIIALKVNTGVMVHIVANGMYKDKKKIALQEIIANALDAIARKVLGHGIENFSPRVSVLIDLEAKVICIRDNGIGMTRKIIEDVYSVFGNSDKRDISEEGGMFGVGAKTPFALADEFMVTTISALTRSKMKFLVNKRLIKVLEEGIADPSEESGTEVEFTLPDEHCVSFTAFETELKHLFGTRKCPIYLKGRERYGAIIQERLISKNIPLANIKEVHQGAYDFLSDPEIFSVNKEDYAFAVYEEKNGHSEVFINHVPYEIDLKTPFSLKLVLTNPNLLTMSATREGVERDTKYNAMVRKVELDLKEKFIPLIDEHFRTLPTPEQLTTFKFTTLRKLSRVMEAMSIKPDEYPLYKLLNRRVKCYLPHNDSMKIIEMMTRAKTVFWSSTALRSNVKSAHFAMHPSMITIYLQDLCRKATCDAACKNYEQDGIKSCLKQKVRDDAIMHVFAELPKLTAGLAPRSTSYKTVINDEAISFSGIYLSTRKRIRCTPASKDQVSITTEDLVTNFPIVKVTPAIFEKLKTKGWKTVDSKSYGSFLRNKLVFKDINEVEIKASDLRKYDTVFYNVDSYYNSNNASPIVRNILKTMFPGKSLFIKEGLNSTYAAHIALKGQRFFSYNDLENLLRGEHKEVTMTITVPMFRLTAVTEVLSKNRIEPKDVQISAIEVK
jgi:hypothetical protein